MGKKKIVIDTNNLISALGWEGKSRELLRKVIDKEYELFISVEIFDELKRVMNYPKFKFTEEQKNRFLDIISAVANVVDVKIKVDISRDPDDDKFIECALQANVDYLVSGDDDLKDIKQVKDVKIVSVSDLLEKKK